MVHPPYLLRWMYPGVKWRIPGKEKVLYLTFDDGPVPEVSPEVLRILKHHQAKATFFCIGDNVRKYPGLYQQIRAEGHRVGNHTFSHLNSWKVSSTDYLRDTGRATHYIESSLFRPPYGKLTPPVLYALKKQFRIYMWDVISNDFDAELSPDQVLSNVLRYSREGSIVVFHDSIKAAPRLLPVLPAVLDHFSKLGYRFASLPGDQ
ncbi:MAG: polysaccharide deacetylase family protein [Bacteroidia bacterium]|nr:polysaccharide deacetylase family protein [Bacteroidia bacterium]